MPEFGYFRRNSRNIRRINGIFCVKQRKLHRREWFGYAADLPDEQQRRFYDHLDRWDCAPSPPLIGIKKTVAHTLAADFEFDRTKTLGAAPFITSALFVDVNPHVNAAAVKFYADELSRLLRRTLLLRFVRLGITGNV